MKALLCTLKAENGSSLNMDPKDRRMNLVDNASRCRRISELDHNDRFVVSSDIQEPQENKSYKHIDRVILALSTVPSCTLSLGSNIFQSSLCIC